MQYIIDEFDVNVYDAYHVVGDERIPEGTVRIAMYAMTRDEDGNYVTYTSEPLLTDEVFDPEYLAEADEDTWYYSHTVRDVDTGPVFEKIKRMHDYLVRSLEGSN